MKRNVTVFEHAWNGCGCFKRILEVTDDNFVSETVDTITVKCKNLDQHDGECIFEDTFPKTVEKFIDNENKWFNNHMLEIMERHEHTIKMANSLKN